MPASTPEPVAVTISLKQVVTAFEQAKLPVTKPVVYDAETDPNGLLGRPNQYVEKMNFIDPRDKKKRSDCTIEVFKDQADAESRKTYIDTIGKASSLFASYSYLHKNVLVRISFGVLPKDAEAYKQALESI